MPTNRTPTRIAGPAFVPDTPATAYTVGASKILVVRFVTVTCVSDPDGIALGIGGVATDDLFLSIAASDLSAGLGGTFWTYEVLTAGETLQWVAGVASTASVSVNADLYDA